MHGGMKAAKMGIRCTVGKVVSPPYGGLISEVRTLGAEFSGDQVDNFSCPVYPYNANGFMGN